MFKKFRRQLNSGLRRPFVFLVLMLAAMLIHPLAVNLGIINAANEWQMIAAQPTSASEHGFSTAHMDLSTSPKVDFYQYAAGTWLRNARIPEDEPEVSVFSQMEESNSKKVIQILESATKNTNASANSIERLVGDFYASGMDSARIESLGVKPLASELARINAIASPADLAKVVAHQHTIGVSPLFGLSVNPDDQQSDTVTFYIQRYEGGISLPDRDLYVSPRFSQERRQYQQHIAKMFQLAGDSQAAASANAKTILDIETALAQSSLPMMEPDDPSATYNKKTIPELKSLAPKFEWDTYLSEIGLGSAPYTIVGQPKYMATVNRLLAERPLADWKTYLRWHLLHNMAPYLNDAFVEEYFRFSDEVLGDMPQMAMGDREPRRREEERVGRRSRDPFLRGENEWLRERSGRIRQIDFYHDSEWEPGYGYGEPPYEEWEVMEPPYREYPYPEERGYPYPPERSYPYPPERGSLYPPERESPYPPEGDYSYPQEREYPYPSEAERSFPFGTSGRPNSGQMEREFRARHVSEVIEQTLGEGVWQLYVKQYFPPQARQRAVQMVENLKDTFRLRLENNDWMSDRTRAEALDKLSRMHINVGYPDKWVDYSSVKIDRTDFLGNVLRVNEFNFRRKVAKVGQPAELPGFDDEGISPTDANASYDAQLNKIDIPAAILQPPFFDARMDDAVNYCAVGAVIAHEITHGFDPQGRLYDAKGSMRDWWVREDDQKFKSLAQRLVNQFNQYQVLPGVRVNGEQTLNENVADLGGISVAYEALQRSMAGKPRPANIDGLTPEQRCFISWAQKERAKTDPGYLREMADEQIHAPSQIRAIAPISNLAEFFTAFEIKSGDPMWRPEAERVKIW